MWRFLAILALVGWALTAGAARAQSLPLHIITAVDLSDSVSEADFDLQMEGLARGVMDERFLADLGEGVGFEVFVWSSGRDHIRTIVPFTVVHGPAEAAAIAAQLRSLSRPAMSYDQQYPSRANTGAQSGATDISEAIDEGVLRSLADLAKRSVINVLADGKDNVPSTTNGGTEKARDRARALGLTINAVIFGDAVTHEGYFHEQVVTGPGAFVEVVNSPAEMIPALERKFWQDMIAGL